MVQLVQCSKNEQQLIALMLSGFARACSQLNNSGSGGALIPRGFGSIELSTNDQSDATGSERLSSFSILCCIHGPFDEPGGCFQFQRRCAGAGRDGVSHAGLRALPRDSRRGRRPRARPGDGRETALGEPDQDAGDPRRARHAALRRGSFKGRSEGRGEIPLVVPDEGCSWMSPVDAGGGSDTVEVLLRYIR